MILDRFQLTGRAAVVTGAGRGIGAATAVALAEAGADVLISARTQGQLDDVAKRIAATGRRAEVVVADLSDLDAVARLAGAAKSAFGRLDIVVNNVGGAMPRPFLDTSPGRMLQAFSFNVATAHALNRSAVPIMRATGEEHGDQPAIVNISSAMGRLSGQSIAAYGTAKAALSHYTRDAAQDLAPQIRVNAIEVGAVATSALEIVASDDAFRERIEQAIPVGRLGEPEDVAAAVVYLASPAASYITGKVIEVDGGIIQSPLSAARMSSP